MIISDRHGSPGVTGTDSDSAPQNRLTGALTSLFASASPPPSVWALKSYPTTMGKRKKAQNIVKVDVSEYAFRKGELLPVLVQHSSKDGRRIEQVRHSVPTPQKHQPPPTFNPSPVLYDPEIHASPAVGEPTEDEPFGSESVCLCSFSSRHILTRVFLLQDPLRLWCEDRDSALREFMFLEGRMGYESPKCYLCSNPCTTPRFSLTEIL